MRYSVACQDKIVAGFASWGPGRDPGFSVPCELYAIYLRPGYERRGIGRRLFESVLSDVTSAESPGLYLTALAINPCRAFYRRLGGAEIPAPSIRLGSGLYDQVGFLWSSAALTGQE